jgi:Tol biopolymer transport system component
MTDILSIRWTPDGSRLALSSSREGTSGFAVFTVPAGGGERLETLLPLAPSELEVAGWSGDPRRLFYLARDPAGGTHLMSRAESEPPQPLHRETGGILSARVSPDRRYVAFDANSEGDLQVYVCPLAGKGGRVTVTSSGGRRPTWSGDGRELFFSRGRQLLSVPVEGTPDGIHFGPERTIVEWDAVANFDVSPDGTLYGLEPVPGAAEQTSLQVQTGWFADVERLAGR